MTNVNENQLDNLHQVEAITSTAQESNDKSDKSKKAGAALLHTLSSAVISAEKNSHKHHAHIHTVDTTAEQELDDSVNSDENVDQNQDLGDSNSESSSDDSQDSETDSGDSDNSDCLMALMMAGIEVSSSKNQEIDATSDMGVKLSTASTNVAKFEQDTVENYYKYGDGTGDDMGDLHTVNRKAGDLRGVEFKIDPNTGHLMMLKNQTAKTWTDLGPAKKTSKGHYDFDPARKAGYGSVYNSTIPADIAGATAMWNASTDALSKGETITIPITGPADSYVGNDDGKGGIKHATSATQSTMMNALQYLQSTASAVNNQIGNVASIPGTTLQGETQSVTSAQSSAQTATQTQSSIAGQASTLASI